MSLRSRKHREGSWPRGQPQRAGQLVFHCLGDTGSTRGPKSQSEVADKMVADYSDSSPQVPSFLYHLGDVIYSFGESQYYYDQFYDPYRDYPAPIVDHAQARREALERFAAARD